MSSLYVDIIRNRDGNGAPVFDKGIVISGIITASGSLAGDSVSIGVTEIVSSSFELKNIAGLDTTTTATIESAIANAPNDFTSLNVSGIATFGSNIDLNADIDIFGHTEINTLNASGILTASTLTTGAESSAIRISSNTISGPATLTIDPAGIGTNTGTVVIQGDLQVEGDTTTINSTTLTVDDKNIILASGSLTDASSDGGGITLESGEGNKTFNWVDATDSWTSSENIDLASNKTFKINTTNVLSSDSLGAGVTNSSLENVGTLAGLNVSGVATVGLTTVLETGILTHDVNVSGAITATTFTGNLEGTVNTATQSNITSLGTLTGLNVSGQTDLNNVNVSGVATVGLTTVLETGILTHDLNVSGVSTFNGDIDVDGHTNLDNVSIAGVVTATTFVGDGDFVELDVDGHTNLDNVSVAGVITATTFVGDGDFVELDVDGHTNLDNVSISGVTTFASDIDVDGHTNLDNVNVSGAITATTFTGNLEGTVNRASQTNITAVGTLTGLTVSGNITAQADLDVDGHTNLDNVSIAGVTTHFNLLDLNNASLNVTGNISGTTINVSGVSTLSGNITAQADLDVDGHTELDNVNISGVTTFASNLDINDASIDVSGNINCATVNVSGASTFTGVATLSDVDITGQLDVQGTSELTNVNVDGFTTITGGTSLANVSISGVTTFTDLLDINNASIDVTGNINAATLRAGISTYTGFVYDELDSDTDLSNGGDFNSITGVAWTSGATDTLYWDFATAPSVIGGEADNGIGTIELANLPTSFQYSTRATLITFTDGDSDWDEGNVVVKVNGQTPTNYLWRNGAQPVGTTTGASNHFDIVEFKIVHDTNNEFSVFAEWQAYHATT